MKQERVILSFIMVLIGLLAAGVIFYFYENSKAIKTPNESSQNNIKPSPTPLSSLFLVINEPKNESISANKTVTLSGKTEPDATVVILTVSNQEVLKPSLQGDFSTTLQIDEGVNYIKIQAIAKNGEIKTIDRIVSFTKEDF